MFEIVQITIFLHKVEELLILKKKNCKNKKKVEEGEEKGREDYKAPKKTQTPTTSQ